MTGFCEANVSWGTEVCFTICDIIPVKACNSCRNNHPYRINLDGQQRHCEARGGGGVVTMTIEITVTIRTWPWWTSLYPGRTAMLATLGNRA